MSVYVNFVKDFPERCENILAAYLNRDKLLGREVTHMLAIAATGLIFPQERLTKCKHPSRDKFAFEKAAKQLINLRKKNFIGSMLWGIEANSWRYGEIPDATGTVEQWKGQTYNINEFRDKFGKNIKIEIILDGLRNALAHGNIFTPGKGKIVDIVFLSKKEYELPEYRVFIVSPDDFLKFLQRWFSFIRNLAMPDGLLEAATG